MWIETNPNPVNNLTDDCVIRAISIILDADWLWVFDELCDIARGMSRTYPYSSSRRGGSYRRSSRANYSMRNYSGHDKKEMLMQRIAELQDEIDRMGD